ncbi:MAG: Rieske 2Fe-2S domain-containing protein [Armatimonadota bacterium]|nr:Rieske 2Fe-2S domain-containing protein [Armatimonadota bacterium]
MPDEKKENGISRREFLTKGALGSFFVAMGGATAGGFALPKPTVSPGPSRRYKLGAPDEFPVGTAVKMDKENLFLFRDDEGYYAITAVCTHLGCIITKVDDGFECPCHGSRFSPDGRVVGGPAPSGLPWLEVSLTPDGYLMVDADVEIAPGTKFVAINCG